MRGGLYRTVQIIELAVRAIGWEIELQMIPDQPIPGYITQHTGHPINQKESELKQWRRSQNLRKQQLEKELERLATGSIFDIQRT